MRLVDREKGDGTLPQQRHEIIHQQPLRGHIDQIELARAHPAFRSLDVDGGHARMNRGRPDAKLHEGVDLVLHQRDQGRNDDSNTRAA